MNLESSQDQPRRDGMPASSDLPSRERERRHRALFSAMDEGFCAIEMVFDAQDRPIDYRFIEFNDAFERMMGVSAEAALAGRSAREVFPALEEFWFEAYGRVARTGEPVRFEQGAEAMGKWFEVHAFRIGDESSLEVGILFKDATERRRWQVDFQRDRAFLNLVTDRLPVRIGYIGPDMRYRYLNGVYERTFGLGPGEGVGMAVLELAGEDAYRKAEPFLRRALAGERNFQSFWADYSFGRRRLEVNYIPDPVEGGVVVHVTDVTERFERDQRLEEGRARRDRALENAEVATFDWDAANDRVYANGLLAQFLGLSPTDAQGGPIARYIESIHPEDRSRVKATIKASLASGGRYETESRVIDAEGAVRHVLARGDASTGPDGKPVRLSGVVLDVTERAHAQAERERLLQVEVQARQTISQREELFRTVFEQAPDDAIVVMDADRTITAWNPAAERICGWTAAEAIGQDADLIFTPEDRAKAAPAAEIEAAAREGKADDERWHMRKDGSRFWGSGTMNSLHVDGTVGGFLKVFRDATARYEETQTLAFLSLLTEAVIDQRDPDRILETVQRMLGRYLGASRVAFGEFAADEDTLSIRQEWGPDAPSILGTYRLSDFGDGAGKALRAGRPYIVQDMGAVIEEAVIVQTANAIGALASIAIPVMKDGRLTALFVAHDRVARKWTDDEVGLVQQVADRLSSEIERARAEAALRASESRFRQLVELSPATVWFAEVDGGLSYISQDFYDATGLTAEQALPHGWASTIHPDDVDRVVECWNEARKAEKTYDTEFRIRLRSGEYQWISARALPIRDADDRVTGWLGSNSDIQSQKETEGTLKAMVDARTQELQKAVQEAEGFNYSISHDLRTPLRAMVATSSILLEDAGPELSAEHRALLVRQAENANRMGRLIDELLRLSRLARVEVHRERLDITAKARSVFEELVQHDDATSCEIDVQEGMVGTGDPNLVRTVFYNLLGNACKFSPQGGLIRVRQEGNVFSVADEGVGFDMRFAPKIFLPFERLVTDAEFPGTGIGLANVRRIVERHGGKVWVESAPGRGTRFSFTLG